MIKKSIILWVALIIQVSLLAQGNLFDEMKAHEEKLNADTKQLNQFFRRFNGEESLKGERFYEGDKEYRERKLRRNFIPALFDNSSSLSEDVKSAFLDKVTDRKEPQFLDFHQDTWFAEVQTEFLYKGKNSSLILFMKLQPQGQGYEWVIDDVIFTPFQKLYSKDTSSAKPFMHPMSHELDFMNLRKALADDVNPESFTKDTYQPDYVTLFIYEVKRGNLKFKTVDRVKFHFFSIDGWYFEVSKFNRPGFNAGWLISGLVAITRDQEEQLKAFIYDK